MHMNTLPTWRTKLFEVVSEEVLPSEPLNLFFLLAPFPYDCRNNKGEKRTKLLFPFSGSLSFVLENLKKKIARHEIP